MQPRLVQNTSGGTGAGGREGQQDQTIGAIRGSANQDYLAYGKAVVPWCPWKVHCDNTWQAFVGALNWWCSGRTHLKMSGLIYKAYNEKFTGAYINSAIKDAFQNMLKARAQHHIVPVVFRPKHTQR